MAATVKRASAAEAAVVGTPWDEAAVATAQHALAGEFAPLSDMRASAGYRTQVAMNLLRRLWLETRREAPLEIHAQPIPQLDCMSCVPHRRHAASPRAGRVLPSERTGNSAHRDTSQRMPPTARPRHPLRP